ncbi:cytochrome c biogenesis protein ResB, partial [bacterium]|nr:cytochrome c biogenesis protein ResB [bacterium]
MKKIFSSKLSMIVMLLIFAVSIGIATFIENNFGTETARRVIYEARWLEVLLLLLVINLISQIIRHRLWKKGKQFTLLFHSAFVILFIGGGITRYFGMEGFIHIREGEVADRITTLKMGYEYRSIPLPFSLKLNDFEITRYPGSDQPSSFTSQVLLIDQEKEIQRPYSIYMNHILNYRGYRFYQASYDDDEMGTILSVSRDPGTPVTYCGYFLLFFALLANFFNPQSRFRKLGITIKQLQIQKQSLLIFLILGVSVLAFTIPVQAQSDRNRMIEEIGIIDEAHAKEFGELMIQDAQGRIKPIDTFARDILHKLVRADRFLSLDANQVILSIMAQEQIWQHVPMIPVKQKSIRALLGMDPEQKSLTLLDFFDPESGGFKLADPIQTANQKRPAERSKMDKELIQLGEQVQVCYMLNRGFLFRIFPKPDDPQQKWTYYQDAVTTFPETEARLISEMFESYLTSVRQADWNYADEALSEIKTYQMKYGSAVYPTD